MLLAETQEPQDRTCIFSWLTFLIFLAWQGWRWVKQVLDELGPRPEVVISTLSESVTRKEWADHESWHVTWF